jgi:hypothetical protein
MEFKDKLIDMVGGQKTPRNDAEGVVLARPAFCAGRNNLLIAHE